jgi:hypothetical protein
MLHHGLHGLTMRPLPRRESESESESESERNDACLYR